MGWFGFGKKDKKSKSELEDSLIDQDEDDRTPKRKKSKKKTSKKSKKSRKDKKEKKRKSKSKRKSIIPENQDSEMDSPTVPRPKKEKSKKSPEKKEESTQIVEIEEKSKENSQIEEEQFNENSILKGLKQGMNMSNSMQMANDEKIGIVQEPDSEDFEKSEISENEKIPVEKVKNSKEIIPQLPE